MSPFHVGERVTVNTGGRDCAGTVVGRPGRHQRELRDCVLIDFDAEVPAISSHTPQWIPERYVRATAQEPPTSTEVTAPTQERS